MFMFAVIVLVAASAALPALAFPAGQQPLALNEFAQLEGHVEDARESLLLAAAAAAGAEVPDVASEQRIHVRSNSEIERELDAFIKGIWDCGELTGTSVSVVRRGQVVYAKGHGVRDIDTREPVDENTLFGIGSTTKAFTTTLIAMAVSEGKLDWDAPIVTYLPDFRLVDPYMTAHATLRDLCGHKLGIPRHDYAWFFGNAFNDSRHALIHNMRYFPSTFGFRTEFQYNNFAYTIAGEIVAKAFSTTWEKLVETRIFKPLGMLDTTTVVAEALERGKYAIPFGKDPRTGELKSYPRDINKVIEYMCAAGCILSTAKDMAKWIQFQAGRGAFGGEQLLDAQHLLRTQTNEFPLPLNSGFFLVAPQQPQYSVGRSSDAMGLGWARLRTRGFPAIAHGGGTLGHTTQLEIVQHPRAETGVFASQIQASPKAHGAQHFITAMALDLALDLEPWFDVDFVCQALSGIPAAAPASPAPADVDPRPEEETAQLRHALAGVYVRPGYGRWSIKEERGAQPRLTSSFNMLHGGLSGLTRTGDAVVADLDISAPWDLILGAAKVPQMLVFDCPPGGGTAKSFAVAAFDPRNPVVFRRVA